MEIPERKHQTIEYLSLSLALALYLCNGIPNHEFGFLNHQKTRDKIQTKPCIRQREFRERFFIGLCCCCANQKSCIFVCWSSGREGLQKCWGY